jgi:aldose 1-epimerase
VSEQTFFQGYPAVAVRSSDLEAVFAPSMGMLGCSLLHDGDELLHHRGGLARYEATGSTMGIPLLHPWANRLGGSSYTVGERTVEIDMDSPQVRTDPNALPMHGLIHASYWDEREPSGDAAAVGATLDLAAHPELAAEFPFPHTITVTATVGDNALTVEATVEATGEVPVPLAFGFHPYFVLPGVPRADWQVEIPLTERLLLDDRMIPTGASETVEPFSGPLGERTFDDGYAGARDGTRFALSGGGRRIEVELVSGYRYAQVYAPEAEETISFEPMTAPTDALRSGRGLEFVEPGERRTATFAISVTRA